MKNIKWVHTEEFGFVVSKEVEAYMYIGDTLAGKIIGHTLISFSLN